MGGPTVAPPGSHSSPMLSRLLPRFVSESRLWHRITHPYTRLTLRVARTCALGAGIYGAGYAGGVQSALDDPEAMGTSILKQVLRGAGGNALVPADAAESQLTTRLGQELLVAARAHLLQASDETQDPQELERLASRLRALSRPHWRFVIIDDDTVDAFVTAYLPGFVFVHRGYLKLFESKPEQLAFVIGNQLSHYLLEHSSADASLKGAVSLLQLVVLVAVDPTGLLAVLAELGLVGQALSLAFESPVSRKHALEADALGLQLCARACCDPRVAVTAHEALASAEASQHVARGGALEIPLVATTPSSATARIEALAETVPAAVQLYENNGCHARKRVLLRALRLVDH